MKIISTAVLMIIAAFNLYCDSNPPPEVVVLQAGNTGVSEDQFHEEFTLYPSFRTNSSRHDAMLQQADFLTRRIHLYLAAKTAGFDSMAFIRQQRQYILQREMLNELYQQQVLDKIPVSEEEVWTEYKKQNTVLAVRHLFVKKKDDIVRLNDLLSQGVDYRELARAVFSDSALAGNGGYLGWLRLTDFDPLLVDSLYQLRIGAWSRPLESGQGWHLFRVEDVKQSGILDPVYFERNQEDLRAQLQTRKAFRASAEYVQKTLKGKSVEIRREMLEKLSAIVSQNVPERSGQQLMLQPQVNDGELVQIQNEAGRLADSTLVLFDGHSWTTGEFVARLVEMPPFHRPAITNINNLTRAIIDRVRDEFLLQEAFQRGLDQSERVQQQVAQYEKVIMANAFERSIQVTAIKEIDPEAWQQRMDLFRQIQTEYPAALDTSALFKGLTKEALNEKMPLIRMVLRQQYQW